MNGAELNDLEQRLAQATRWDDAAPAPAVWERALESVERGEGRRLSLVQRLLMWPLPKLLAACVAVALIAAIAGAILLPSVSKSRSQSLALGRANTNLAPTPSIAAPFSDRSMTYVDESFAKRAATGAGGGDLAASNMTNGLETGPLMSRLHSAALTANVYQPEAGGNNVEPLDGLPPSSSASADTSRQVIRKATIELISNDVRAAFLKALHVVSEAGGEYVQDSALSGEAEHARANLTLRIAVDRLGAVLNELRELGKVESESLAGEDVTAQIVDLEARLRNEQRVETELLELLGQRQDAPLKEILELRDQIAQVRQQIEQIIAQRERLGRLVSLATILVIIRAEQPQPATQPEPEPVQERTLGEYFKSSISDSWRNGLTFLADTIANLLSVLVGGLIWWIVLVAALLALRNQMRRRMIGA